MPYPKSATQLFLVSANPRLMKMALRKFPEARQEMQKLFEANQQYQFFTKWYAEFFCMRGAGNF